MRVELNRSDFNGIELDRNLTGNNWLLGKKQQIVCNQMSAA